MPDDRLVPRDERGGFTRRAFFKGTAAISAVVAWVTQSPVRVEAQEVTYRCSFLDSSWWNTPATGVPVDPYSARYIANLKATEPNDHIGIGVGSWAMFFGDSEHIGPLTTITNKKGQKVSIHIPPEVKIMEGNDHAAVFRCARGGPDGRGCDLEVSVFEYDVTTHRCTNFGVYRVSGDGVDRKADPPGDGPGGHRGIPPSAMFITGQEMVDGYIGHRLKIGVKSPADRRLDGKAMPIWPMAGYERGHGTAIPEGAVLRLKRGAFDRVDPQGPARVVATAARDFGLLVGETGGHASCKFMLNATAPTGMSKALDAFGFGDYEVLQLGFR